MSYEMMEVIEQTSSSFKPFFFPIDADLTSDVTDLLVFQRTAPFSSEKRLRAISDRVSSLESRFDRLLSLKEREGVRRKYTWTAEIKGKDVGERKYKWTAEIDGDDDNVKKYQWRTEIKKKGDGDDDVKKTYTWQATIGGDHKEKEKKKKKKSVNGACGPRIVEIDEHTTDYRALILRQAYAKRIGRHEGKAKEVSPQDAAAFIQTSFKTHLIRRSQTLRALRELAVAKTKLKELRSSFHNFSFRSRLSRDAEERQKFSEKIIVVLLTVDAIDGVDMMVRSAKRSMVDELEAMLDVVDPQPPGKTQSMRRTFDVPSGVIQKEIAQEVAHVVHLLDEENTPF